MAGAASPRPLNRPMISVSIMAATVMQALDTTIANVALPHMQGSLSATQDQISWVLTSYIVAAAIMTPLTGWLAGRFGRKQLFATAVIGFTLDLDAVRRRPVARGDGALPPAAGRVRRSAGAAVAIAPCSTPRRLPNTARPWRCGASA